MRQTDKQTPAPVAIPDREWQKVIKQQADSIARKDKQLARLDNLLTRAQALNGSTAPRRAYLS